MTRKRLLIGIPAVACAAWLLAAGGCGRRPPGPAAEKPVRLADGTPAPDFCLPTLDGRTVTLSAAAGKVRLVEFWAAWCPPCRAAFPRVDSLYRAERDGDPAVFSVCTSSSREELERFLAGHPDHGLPVLFDAAPESLSVGFARYRIDGFPSFFLVDRSGRIVKSFKGFWDGRTFGDLVRDLDSLDAVLPERS